MSLKAIVEILVNFQYFRNIDLFHQGVYQLKATIHQIQQNVLKSSQPYMILDEPVVQQPKLVNVFGKASSKNIYNNSKTIIQGSVLQDVEFWSKAFLVKYCDESIDLNDGCVFRCELDAFPKLNSSELYFSVELMYTELSSMNQEDFEMDKLRLYMKPVAKFQSKINNIFTGIKEYVPIMFDQIHFCIIHATVQSLLIDFKFRQGQNIDINNEIVSSENFEQFLKRITKTFQKDLVDDFYATYVRSLKSTHEEFLKYHQMVVGLLKDPMLIGKYKNSQLSPHFPLFLKNVPEEQKNQDKEITITNYFDTTNPKSQNQMCSNLILVVFISYLKEINQLSSILFQVWYQFLEVFAYTSKDVMSKLEVEYGSKIKDRWGESIFQNITTVSDLASSTERKVGKRHKDVAQQIRGKEYYQLLETLCIEDLNLFPQAKIHPILFKEVFIDENAPTATPLPNDGLHLIVFAHGYQGNSFDMRLWKNLITLKYPDHILLSTTCNEDNTEQDIFFMGQRLAEEVISWIKDWSPKEKFSKLSFVGHSLGGLIIRAALPHLDRYKDKMYTFMTLATPHLGFLLSSSKVVDTGIWVIKKWKKCICLNQLTLTDSNSYEQTCLYRLSTTLGLGWFKNIILVSSYQDSYSPFESARIQRTDKASLESEKGRIYNKMIDNIFGQQLQTDRIQRLDVNYELSGNNIDNMIGRSAHIAFLENSALVKLIIYSFQDLFD